jgi:hypothetical protein
MMARRLAGYAQQAYIFYLSVAPIHPIANRVQLEPTVSVVHRFAFPVLLAHTIPAASSFNDSSLEYAIYLYKRERAAEQNDDRKRPPKYPSIPRLVNWVEEERVGFRGTRGLISCVVAAAFSTTAAAAASNGTSYLRHTHQNQLKRAEAVSLQQRNAATTTSI